MMKKGPKLKLKYKSSNGHKSLLIKGPIIDIYKASQTPTATTSMTKFF